MSTVLVIAAHPDDEVPGAGGTVARRVFEGDAVYALVLGGRADITLELPLSGRKRCRGRPV